MKNTDRIVIKEFTGRKTRILKPRKNETCMGLAVTATEKTSMGLGGRERVIGNNERVIWDAMDMPITERIKIRGRTKHTRVNIKAIYRQV